MTTEQHPLGLFLPPDTRLLMLGSFPPPRRRWSMDFFYPNIQNDMWRVLGLIFYGDKAHFLLDPKRFSEERAKAFCRERGIGLGDTAREVIRLKENASDKFLEVVRPLDLSVTLERAPACRAVAVTGQKALDTLLLSGGLTPVDPAAPAPPVGSYVEMSLPVAGQERQIRLYRMPSTSRAYPKPLEEKALVYRKMFQEIGILG